MSCLLALVSLHENGSMLISMVCSIRPCRRCVFFLTELVTGGELLDALDALGLLNHSQARESQKDQVL